MFAWGGAVKPLTDMKFRFTKRAEDVRVLIVEDDALLVRVLEDVFRAEGITTQSIGDGTRVLDAAKEYQPHVIILDLILPGIDGFEVLRQLKDDVATRAIPVFIASNLDDPADIKSAKALGATDYLIKANMNLADLIRAVRGAAK